jgi:hypothetical protein
MKRVIQFISLIIVLTGTMIISLSSCVSNNLHNETGYYYVESIDSSFFVDYNSIFLSNKGKESIWLLSEKLLNKDTIYNSIEKYQKLKEKSFVKLDLIKNDKLKYIKSKLIKHRVSSIVYVIDDNVIAWQDDTIKYNIYFSPQVLDVYVIKHK